MKTVVIIQARMTSTRLPGKVLMELAGEPMLARQIARLRRCREADELMLATTTNADDDPLVALARDLGVGCFRGSEHDVLARYVGAARQAAADLVARVTSDCPLIDPAETDRVIAALKARRATHDYAANVLDRRLPRGLDTEALWADALERAARMAESAPAREHVTYFLVRERPEWFRRHSVRAGDGDDSDLRWTVDTPDDLALVRRLYDDLNLAERPAPFRDIVAHVRRHPEIAAINGHIAQKAA